VGEPVELPAHYPNPSASITRLLGNIQINNTTPKARMKPQLPPIAVALSVILSPKLTLNCAASCGSTPMKFPAALRLTTLCSSHLASASAIKRRLFSIP